MKKNYLTLLVLLLIPLWIFSEETSHQDKPKFPRRMSDSTAEVLIQQLEDCNVVKVLKEKCEDTVTTIVVKTSDDKDTTIGKQNKIIDELQKQDELCKKQIAEERKLNAIKDEKYNQLKIDFDNLFTTSKKAVRKTGFTLGAVTVTLLVTLPPLIMHFVRK